MAQPRSESQRERDRKRINELYLQGWTQTDIAAELGISARTVYTDIRVLQKEWKDSRKDIKEEFATRYAYIYREAVTAWHRSKEDAETTTQEMIDGGEGAGTGQRLKASTRKEGQSGNPALLAQAQGALKAIREMFGVDAAKAGESDDKPFIVKVVRGVSVDDL